ncbi:MAG: thymidylate synthase [Nanobdellota archaeon]
MESIDFFEYRDLLMFGSTDASIGIVTLWTAKETIAEHVGLDRVAIIGQLYSKYDGINALLRNLLQAKHIRHIIVTGQDLSNSGEALLRFSQRGLNGRRISGTDIEIEADLPLESVEQIRTHVSFHDYREMKDFTSLKSMIASLPTAGPYGVPEIIPRPKPTLDQKIPSTGAGFQVTADKVGTAWLEILKNVLDHGTIKRSQHHDDQTEIINVMAVITDEDPDDIQWFPFFEFQQQELSDYYESILTKRKQSGISYTYGQRLRDHHGIDQIQSITADLRNAGHSRRALAVTWNVASDYNNPSPPCLIFVQALVQEHQLFFTAFFRSHDIYGCWPQNAFALRRLQANICKELGFSLGPLTIISGSAHIYESSWRKTQNILREYKSGFTPDPNGSFIITIEKGEIVLEHQSPTGKSRLSADSAMKIIRKLNPDRISQTSHALYLGKELCRAEYALKNKIPYVQD